jgi:hypothetical protein
MSGIKYQKTRGPGAVCMYVCMSVCKANTQELEIEVINKGKGAEAFNRE